jgi:hypothetical protein
MALSTLLPGIHDATLRLIVLAKTPVGEATDNPITNKRITNKTGRLFIFYPPFVIGFGVTLPDASMEIDQELKIIR